MKQIKSNQLKVLLIYIFLLLCFVNNGFCVDYIRYVSTTGLDSNTGDSTGNEWKTFHYALTQINSIALSTGDTITLYVTGGDYSVSTTGETSTAAQITNNDTTIDCTGAGDCIINGTGAATGWSTGVEIQADNINIKNISVTGFNWSQAGIKVISGTGAKIEKCKIYSNANGVIIDSSSTSSSINECSIYNNSSMGVYINSSNNNIIDGCIIYDNSSGVRVDSAAGTEIRKNEIYNTGASSQSSGIRLELASAASNLIEFNKIYGHHYVTDSEGIRLTNSFPMVKNNEIYDNYRGIFIYGEMGESSPILINNVIYGSSSTAEYGIYIKGFSTGGTASPSILHNTLSGGLYSGIYMETEVDAVSPVIKYNIISSYDGSELGIGAGTITPQLDYNDVWDSSGGSYGGVTTGLHDISADPVFDSVDYSIQSISPCIDAIPQTIGDAETNKATIDFTNTTRPRDGDNDGATDYDIGAYEYPLVQYTFTMPGGTGLSTDYKMMTIPHYTDAGPYTTMLEALFGTYDNTLWRMFVWNGSAYVEFGEATFDSLLMPGKAFWVISLGTDSGITEGSLCCDDTSFETTLNTGWNQIALPWKSTPIQLGKIAVGDLTENFWITSASNTLTQKGIWEYTGTGGYVEQTSAAWELQPGVGYWIDNLTASTLTIYYPPDNTGTYFIAHKAEKGFYKKEGLKDDDEPPAPPGSEIHLKTTDDSTCFIRTILGLFK